MVIEKRQNPDGTGIEEIRRTMTLGQAYSEIDFSRQHSFCKECGHDINIHEDIADYKTKFAGRCLYKAKKQHCHCESYMPGPVMTTKELKHAKFKDDDYKRYVASIIRKDKRTAAS